jgi:RNA polymerase sigma-70 factor (sigma-E family)
MTAGAAGPAPTAGLPAGRDAALTVLFRVHYARLVGLARVLVGAQESAEDVVQDAFAALSRHWRSLRDKDAAPAWLQTAVLNAARGHLRRRSMARRVLAVTPSGRAEPEQGASAEVAALEADDHRRVVDELRRLPTRQREVLVLRYLGGLSEAEIADRLGISTGSVKRHAARALARLATQMEGWR